MYSDIIRKILLERLGTNPFDESLFNYVVNNSNSLYYMEFHHFYSEANCSPKEATLFLESLGFDDYDQFRYFIRDTLRSESLLKENKSSRREHLINVINKVADMELGNIALLLADPDLPEKIERFSTDVINSPGLFIIGTRAASSIAQYAAMVLSRIGINVTKADTMDSYFFDTINSMDRSTLVIVFAFPRYPKGTVVLSNLLKHRGFRLIAFTDTIDSPLAKLADYSLIAPVKSMDYTDSFSSIFALVNMISIYISMQDITKSSNSLKAFDELAEKLDYFL